MEFDIFFALRAFVALFVIVDPIANIPVFISILDRFRQKDRYAIIKKSVFVAFISLVVLTLLGNYIFQLLGITIYSFRIAGGLLLLVIAIEMLFGKKSKKMSEDALEEEKEDITIMPLAIPMLTGPGAITTGIVLYDSATGLAGKIVLLACITAVFLATYVILRQGEAIHKKLGKTGNKVIVRLMGLMLAAIAVQFVISGISEAVQVYPIP